MIPNSFASLYTSPEGQPSGVVNGMYGNQFTDANGRTLLQQYPQEAAMQQPINNTQMLDNHFDNVRASNMSMQQGYIPNNLQLSMSNPADRAFAEQRPVTMEEQIQMRAQVQQQSINPMLNYYSGQQMNQNRFQPFGSCMTSNLYPMSGMQYTPTVQTNVQEVNFDTVFNNNQRVYTPYNGYFNNVFSGMQYQQPIIYDGSGFKPSMGYMCHNVGYNPTHDNLLPEAKEDNEPLILIPDYDLMNNTNNNVTQSNNLYSLNNNQVPVFNYATGRYETPIGSTYSCSFPNSIFNGYQNPFFTAGYRMKSAEELQQEAMNQFRVIKTMANCAANFGGLESPTDEEILERIKRNVPQQPEPHYTQKLKVYAVTADGSVYDPYGDDLSKPSRVVDENVAYQQAANYYFNSVPYNILYELSVINHNKIYDEHKAKYPDKMGIVEFLNNAGGIYSDMLVREGVKNKRIATIGGIQKKLFDEEIAKARTDSEIFMNNNSTLNRNCIIDAIGLRNMSGDFVGQFANDQEYTDYTGISLNQNGGLDVKVPQRLLDKTIDYNTDYQRRRSKFIDTITAQKPFATPERLGV